MTEVEVFQIQDNYGNLQFYEITPLQKRILMELPLLTEKEVSSEIERIMELLLNESKTKRELIIMQLPFITQLSKKLNVTRATLVNALNRRNASRPSLMDMGLVGKVKFGNDILTYSANYFYKMYDGEFVIQEIEETKSVINREHITPGYNKWRENVLNRDRFCQCCGFDKHLQVHHLFGYTEHPELATDMNNGVTLCKFCHDKYHSIYGLKDINPLDYMEFMDRFKVEL